MLLAAAVVVLVSVDVRQHGPLYHADIAAGRRLQSWDLRHHLAVEVPLRALVLFGQRGVVLPLSVAFLGWLSWRARTSEPLIRLLGGLLAVAVVVYALKYTVTRPAPVDYFTGAAHPPTHSYPSGHMANAVALWGLALWAALRWPMSERVVAVLAVLRRIAPVAVVVGMTLLNYHWLSDFVAGAAAGVLALALATATWWSPLAASLDPRLRRR